MDASFSIDDLTFLEPRYLAESFSPRAYGFDDEELAWAFAWAAPQTRAYLARHADADTRRALSRVPRGEGGDTDTARLAAERLLARYVFQVSYRKYPQEYEAFARSQRFALDEIFPIEVYAGKRVLDVGCGTGKIVDHLAGVAREVIGVDQVPAMLDVARRKHADSRNVRFLVGTFQELPLPPGSVDMVTSNMAFPSHIETGGGPSALRELARVVRPGGEVRLTVYGPHAVELMRDHGFTVRSVDAGLVYEAVADCDPVVWTLRRVATGGQLIGGSVPATQSVTLCHRVA